MFPAHALDSGNFMDIETEYLSNRSPLHSAHYVTEDNDMAVDRVILDED